MEHIVKDFQPQGGKHCITNALKQVFAYHGYEYSEAMLFGLASGLSFLYLNQATSPMVNGRTKIGEFEQQLAKRLGMQIINHRPKTLERAIDITKQMIDAQEPVFLYVDMPYLSYLELPKQSHFGGHAIVCYGYDEGTQTYRISDRDSKQQGIPTPKGIVQEDSHLLSYEQLHMARSSKARPFPANNQYLTFDFTHHQGIQATACKDAIRQTVAQMLEPPAKLLGCQGILKFANEIKKWKSFSDEALACACMTNYFQISADGGTGGGIFRHMYGDFLVECADVLKQPELLVLAKRFHTLASVWDTLAVDLKKLSTSFDRSCLPDCSDKIMKLYDTEVLLFQDLAKVIA